MFPDFMFLKNKQENITTALAVQYGIDGSLQNPVICKLFPGDSQHLLTILNALLSKYKYI